MTFEDAGGRSESFVPATTRMRTQFTFVCENTQSSARSHAMREHWRERKERERVDKSTHVAPILCPKATRITDIASKAHENGDRVALTPSERPRKPDTDAGSDCEHYHGFHHDIMPSNSPLNIIASELLVGINRVLSPSRLDPFDTFPVRLTSDHHKLLYHWITSHAAMMFEDLDIPSFNPMKDVWFPLDLSNAASFNCIMAHSAAHLGHLYAGTSPGRPTNSSDAVKYKAEAVRVLSTWISDPAKALSNHAFAAVVRLLTFERYWGTKQEWLIHRIGLQRMINARGGIISLRDNWRLELAVYLVTLMTEPSWFESVNHISDISESDQCNALDPSLDVQKVRCLWLVSLIQDMRTFMGSAARFYVEGLSTYPSVYDAVRLIYLNFQLAAQNTAPDAVAPASEFDRLFCLFSVAVMMQEGIPSTHTNSSDLRDSTNSLTRLDIDLMTSQWLWESSVRDLRTFLHHHLVEFHADGFQKIDYITNMADVLNRLSIEARRGVEKCLINLLCRSKDKETFLIDDGWTPDSLLSSVHGQ